MTRSPLFNFLFGMIAGTALGAGTLAYVSVHGTRQLEAQAMSTITDWEKVSSGWQGRAQKCEAKFTVGTIVYEPHPVAELPLLHGAVSLTVNQNELRPAWFIPAQVPVYTNVPGARYQWQDMKSGAILGEFVAEPPSAMASAGKQAQ